MQRRGRQLNLLPRGEGHMGGTVLKTDGFEILKHALTYVWLNRFLWPLAFLIALAGAGAQGLSLWLQSPVYTVFTRYGPVQGLSERIKEYGEGNAYFWVALIVAGAVVGIVVIAFGVIAQAAAISGVSDIDSFGEGKWRRSWRDGLDAFPRCFKLTILYILMLIVFAAPTYLLFWLVPDRYDSSVLLLLGGLLLGAVFVIAAVAVMVIVELSLRYLVLHGTGVIESVRKSTALLRKFWREVIVAFFYVLILNIAGGFSIIILMAVIESPLVWVFTKTTDHPNPFSIALSLLAFVVAWAVSAALLGAFAITSSAVWTLTFLDLQTSMHSSEHFVKTRMPAPEPLDSVQKRPELTTYKGERPQPSPVEERKEGKRSLAHRLKSLAGTLSILLLLPILKYLKPKQNER